MLREFWGRCLEGKEEVAWEMFWKVFPVGLSPEGFVDIPFNSPAEQAAFQKAVRVVGSADYFTVAMADCAFPPGCSIGSTVARHAGSITLDSC